MYYLVKVDRGDVEGEFLVIAKTTAEALNVVEASFNEIGLDGCQVESFTLWSDSAYLEARRGKRSILVSVKPVKALNQQD